jgi:hypothetical protein
MDQMPIRERRSLLEAVLSVQSELIKRSEICPTWWDQMTTAALHFFIQFYQRVWERPPAYGLLAMAAFHLASHACKLHLPISVVARLVADEWHTLPRAEELDGIPEPPIDVTQLAHLILQRHQWLCNELDRNLSFPKVDRVTDLVDRVCASDGVQGIVPPTNHLDFLRAVLDDAYDPTLLHFVLRPFLGLPKRHFVLSDSPIGYHLLFFYGSVNWLAHLIPACHHPTGQDSRWRTIAHFAVAGLKLRQFSQSLFLSSLRPHFAAVDADGQTPIHRAIR